MMTIGQFIDVPRSDAALRQSIFRCFGIKQKRVRRLRLRCSSFPCACAADRFRCSSHVSPMRATQLSTSEQLSMARSSQSRGMSPPRASTTWEARLRMERTTLRMADVGMLRAVLRKRALYWSAVSPGGGFWRFISSPHPTHPHTPPPPHPATPAPLRPKGATKPHERCFHRCPRAADLSSYTLERASRMASARCHARNGNNRGRTGFNRSWACTLWRRRAL